MLLDLIRTDEPSAVAVLGVKTDQALDTLTIDPKRKRPGCSPSHPQHDLHPIST